MLFFLIFIAGGLLLAYMFVVIFRYLQQANIKDEKEKKLREDKQHMDDWKDRVEKSTMSIKDKKRILSDIKFYGTWNKNLWLRALSLGFFISYCLAWFSLDFL